MNVRKAVDYSAMFAALDMLMAAELPQSYLKVERNKQNIENYKIFDR